MIKDVLRELYYKGAKGSVLKDEDWINEAEAQILSEIRKIMLSEEEMVDIIHSELDAFTHPEDCSAQSWNELRLKIAQKINNEMLKKLEEI
jgi:hypothetical protein